MIVGFIGTVALQGSKPSACSSVVEWHNLGSNSSGARATCGRALSVGPVFAAVLLELALVGARHVVVANLSLHIVTGCANVTTMLSDNLDTAMACSRRSPATRLRTGVPVFDPRQVFAIDGARWKRVATYTG